MTKPVIACRSCGTKNRLPVVAHGTPEAVAARLWEKTSAMLDVHFS